MKRLIKKNYHDTDNREFAMIYIENEFISGDTHAECVQEYFSNNRIRPVAYTDRIEDRSDFEYELNKNDKINNLPFACINAEDDNLFIELDTLRNISLDELVSKIKQYFSSFNIYEETNNYEDDISNYKQLN